MGDTTIDPPDTAKWDRELIKRVIDFTRPIAKRYFRSEVRDLDNIPSGGVLVVSNHSGGLLSMDIPIFAVDFYDKFGYDRPLHPLTHDMLVTGLKAEFLMRTGIIRANSANAASALGTGAVALVYPGGDYDVYRPTMSQNKIDFNGRAGYVRTAIEAGVPIVPAVSIGGQETQLYLTRGMWLAERLGLKRLLRTQVLPITFGFPFGLSAVIPINVPLPTKIVTEVLAPIDITAQFGEDPDIHEVDAHIRAVMQAALDRLARERRLPVLG